MTEHPVIEVYHATSTGIDDDILESFIKDGARSDIDVDHNTSGSFSRESIPRFIDTEQMIQDTGFYVFTQREGALAYLDELEELKGLPMIVTVDGVLDPFDWKLDEEAHANMLSAFVYDNFPAIYDILDRMIETDRGEFYPSRSHRDTERKKMVMKFKDGKKWRQKTYPEEVKSDEVTGIFFGDIIEELSREYPAEIRYAQTEWLKQAAESPELWALKYVGFDPVPVKKLEVLMDGEWVQHEF